MKIGIIGAGFVGSTAAYAMVMRGVGREIVLVDLNQARAEAEADDILHAVPFANPLQVRAGGYQDLKDCRAVVITAGVSQKPGETRLQLLERNANVFRQIVPQILENAPDAVLVVATNPVDIMTHLTAHFAAEHGVPSGRVVGSGTTLDTARFRALLGKHLGVDSYHVHAYVIGEHGDSEVLAWSATRISALALDEFCRLRGSNLNDSTKQEIEHRVRHAAYHIIEGKGATYYGIGAALAKIVSVILGDQRAILTVCTPTEEVAGVPDVTVALPRMVGGEGVMESLPLTLAEPEQEALHDSAQIIRDAIDELNI